MGGNALGETELQRGRERERDGREHIRRDRATERERTRDGREHIRRHRATVREIKREK